MNTELRSIRFNSSKPQFGGAINPTYIVIAIIVLALIGFLIYKYYFKTSKVLSVYNSLPLIIPSFQTFPLTIYGGATANYSPPFQPVSTIRTTNPFPLRTSSPITTINIQVNFGFNVSTTTPLILSNYPAITPTLLQQEGIFVQIDILPASAVNSFYLTNNFTQSYFNTNTSSTFSPTLYISLIDTHNIVYAAGAATFSMFTGQQIPTAINFTVTLNNDTTLTQTHSLSGTGPFPAILVLQE